MCRIRSQSITIEIELLIMWKHIECAAFFNPSKIEMKMTKQTRKKHTQTLNDFVTMQNVLGYWFQFEFTFGTKWFRWIAQK